MRVGGNVVLAFALGLGIAQADAATSLTVLLYNYAQVPNAILADAESFAARSYHAAGIELTWVECSVSKDGSEKFHLFEPANIGRPVFLKIIPETMAADIHPSSNSGDFLGIAFVSHAFVVYPRIRELARVWGVPEYMILGRTMAHELGHVLLGRNSHTAAGLMRSGFAREDLSLESGQFLFDSQQAKRLRGSLP
jgi:hypothetical protein